jgi:hypothetical protein
MTYKTSSGLDDWIYCTLYIHTTLYCRQYSAIADLHTLQFSFTHALGFSVFTSRILATKLQQSHCHFRSHMKTSFPSLISFLPLFCNFQFRTLDSIQFLCSKVHIPLGWRLETWLCTLCCPLKFFFITTLHGTQGKHRLHVTVLSKQSLNLVSGNNE